ncbi:MAG: hypothetical protein U9N14_06085, partial [Pseudomonadota bacterium]|nr:hypothetical protein [Pseudomonadota bacterium]
FNGLSDNNAEQALNDPDMATRLARGELFVTGRHYLAGAFNIELHPLTRFLIGGMVNLQDRSGLVQPHISQSLTQNSDLNIGANLPFGPPGSEYGGRRIPGTSLYDEPSASLFAWISWYF